MALETTLDDHIRALRATREIGRKIQSLKNAGKSYKEIGDELDITGSNARDRWLKAEAFDAVVAEEAGR